LDILLKNLFYLELFIGKSPLYKINVLELTLINYYVLYATIALAFVICILEMFMFKKILSVICVILFMAISLWIYFSISNNSQNQVLDSSLDSLLANTESHLGRIEKLNNIKEREFYIILARDDNDYSKILSLANSLRGLDGITWYADTEYMSFFKRESYYRNPEITGVKDKATLLEHLNQESNGLSKQELTEQALADPFAFTKSFEMPPFKGTKDNIIYFIADNDSVCGSSHKCYLLHGVANESDDIFVNNSDLVAKIEGLTNPFSQSGGYVELVGGILAHNDFISLLIDDISLIWGCAVVIILIIFSLCFKSVRPFFELLLAGAVALSLGALATIGLLGSIHLLTITLLVPILGIIADLYLYFCNEMDSNKASFRVKPAILCLAITFVTYGFMAFTGLIVFIELAVFVIVSLVIFFCIIYGAFVWFKPISKEATFRHLSKINIEKIPTLIKCGCFTIIFGLIGISSYGFSEIHLEINEIPQSFLNKPVIDQDSDLSNIVLFSDANLSYFVVFGDTMTSLASRLEEVDQSLEELKAEGKLTDYFTYKNTLIPSAEAMENASFYEKLLPVAQEFYKGKGVTVNLAIPRFVHVPAVEFIKLDSMKNFPFVVDKMQKPYLSMVTVVGLNKIGEQILLRNHPYVESNNRSSAYKDILLKQRNDVLIVVLLMISTLTVMVFVCSGVNGTLGIILPSVIGAGCACLYMTATHIPLSIYTLVAMLLVIGVSTDCALFIRQAPKIDDKRALLTVILAFLFSQLLFGLLSFSSIPNISDIGKVVFVGLFAAILSGIIMNLVVIPPRRVK
jgi:hypothetical protein